MQRKSLCVKAVNFQEQRGSFIYWKNVNMKNMTALHERWQRKVGKAIAIELWCRRGWNIGTKWWKLLKRLSLLIHYAAIIPTNLINWLSNKVNSSSKWLYFRSHTLIIKTMIITLEKLIIIWAENLTLSLLLTASCRTATTWESSQSDVGHPCDITKGSFQPRLTEKGSKQTN